MNLPHQQLSWIPVLVAFNLVVAESGRADGNWPQWRGPDGTGVAPLAKPPLEWSESNNVRWKKGIPGSGSATPIVWENKVFVVTAIPVASEESGPVEEPREPASDPGRPGPGRGMDLPKPDAMYRFVVLCLDRKTGETLWEHLAREEVPHEGHHRDHGFASASPVTDGEHLVAYFGSRGLHCYDLDGTRIWEVDFGNMQTRRGFGEGSSPALHGDTVVVVWDHEGDDDFIVAVNKMTGEERWRTPRNEDTSWTTPVIVEVDGTPQVIVAGTTAVRGYDLATGRELWTGPGLTVNVIPTPVVSDGVVYATSGFRGAALHAIRLGSAGNLEGTDSVLWSHNRNTPYVPSPLLTDNLLYFVSGNNAILSCFDAAKGEAHFAAERLEGLNGIYASPVAAGDRVYVLGRNGVCLVLKRGPELEVLATNTLDDRTDASIALAGDDLFIRGHENLYCIAEP